MRLGEDRPVHLQTRGLGVTVVGPLLTFLAIG
jgi:hypothetical protein